MMPPPSFLRSSRTAAAPAASRPRTPSSRTRRAPTRMRPKKPESISILSLSRPGRNSLSCTTPCLMPAFLAARARSSASSSVFGDRLLAIDVLAGRDRLAQQLGAQLRGGGVEEQRVVLVLQRGVEVGGPARDAVRLGQLLRASRRCGRPGSGRASRGRRSSARRRPGRGSRRSSGSDAGSCPCGR